MGSLLRLKHRPNQKLWLRLSQKLTKTWREINKIITLISSQQQIKAIMRTNPTRVTMTTMTQVQEVMAVAHLLSDIFNS